MFLPQSRYANVAQVTVIRADGSTASAVKLRRLPQVAGDPTTMNANDRLDIIAGQEYGDGTMFWHIADANSELSGKTTSALSPNSNCVLLRPWKTRAEVDLSMP